jgi:hypothetical protein
MPELGRFSGIVVYMMFFDIQQHNIPHIHVVYGEHKAVLSIDGELLAGSLPKKQMRVMNGWLAIHEEEVYEAWNQAVQGKHFEKIQ